MSEIGIKSGNALQKVIDSSLSRYWIISVKRLLKTTLWTSLELTKDVSVNKLAVILVRFIPTVILIYEQKTPLARHIYPFGCIF